MKSPYAMKAFVCLLIVFIVSACGLGEPKAPAAEAVQQPEVAQSEPTQPPAEEPTQPPPPTDEPSPPTPEPPPEIKHVDVPTAWTGDESTIHDHQTKDTGKDRYAYSGDTYVDGLLERPFSREMDYLPWLDIVDANLVREEPFIYFSIVVQERSYPGGGEPPIYGFEIDTDIDGRGDVLVQTVLPRKEEWAQQGVTAFEDSDDSVGGITPVASDGPFGGGDGYDQLVFEAGQGDDPDLAWSRLNPDDPARVDIAFHSPYFTENQIFMWGGFSDGFPGGPESFDLNDRFSLEEAGSALKASEFYPLKNFFAFDNTCRTTSGFTPKGYEPGICPNIVPEAPGRVKQCTEVCNPQGICTTVCD